MRALHRKFPRALGALAIVTAALALGAAPASAKLAPPNFLGVSANENRPANYELDRMGRGKVGVLRLNINWADIEPARPRTPDPFKFDQLDRVVGRAAQNNLTLLPILYGTPRWLAKNPSVAPIRTSEQKAQWQRFVRAIVDRYGPGGTYWQSFQFLFPGAKIKPIRNWQIWNEPTTNQFFRGTSKRKRTIPRDYAKLLAQTSPVIRQEDPAATIVTAGVYGFPHLGKGLQSSQFFRSLLATKGIGRHFDAIGVHPYGASWSGPDGSPNSAFGVKRQMLMAVRELRRSGLRREIWITEIGWPTGGREDDFQAYLKRSKKAQASTMASTFKRLLKRRKSWDLGKVIWFTWRDNRDLGPDFAKCNLCKFAGMFKANHEPKPAWYVYTSFTGGDP